MIVLSGRLRAEPDIYADFLQTLQAGVPATLEEDGCLFYAFAGEDAAQGLILVAERWRDEAALRAHLATPALAALGERFGGRFEIEVSIFEVASEKPFAALAASPSG